MNNNKRILLISILLFLGLFGIAIVQFFWLQKALKSKEQDFEHSVYQSLYDASQEIEKIAIEPIVNELFSQATHSQKINIDNDIAYNYYDSTGNEQSLIFRDSFNADQYGAIKELLQEEMPLQIDNLQQLMAQQMVSLVPLQELLPIEKLDTIIKTCLLRHGIKTKVRYGITEFAPNNFIFISKQTPFSDLYKTKYSIELFPSSIVNQQKTLRLFFPEMKKYLFTSIWEIIVSSIFFFIITVLAFVLAFQVIFKQKKLSDMKTDFINNMTHELKTPIATISLATEMLKDNSISQTEANRTKYANIIFDENKRLANHVEQVLQIARLEKGELELNKDYRSIHQIIETTVKRFQLQLDELEGSIELHLNAENDLAKIDELHFSNAINNLIDNAIKYNDKKPLIKINTYNLNLGIQIEVIDNGIGLSKENQHRVFEKFYRVAKGNVHDVKGFGLGLSYVHSIITGHQGKINVESKLKEGSKFIIQLPLNDI